MSSVRENDVGSVTICGAVRPLPAAGTVRLGLFAPLLWIVTEPEYAPAVAGVQVTWIVCDL